ncbi:hypothetical protein [Nakamurella sp.]|uniref:hypothetical protein n=1 Tax=Nakamurella sp. TaxID=1869182 RepID=UPI003B3B7BF5
MPETGEAELDAKYQRLPARVRQQVEAHLAHSATTMKIVVGQTFADRDVLNAHAVESAGRTGLKSGQVSELTVIAPLKPNGAKRLRTLFAILDGNFAGASLVGTVHDMRFVLLDNDTRLLFCTAYDGEWDPYIDDFATKIPDLMDYIFGNVEGWPGIHSPQVKDFIASIQVGASGWFVANPQLTVAEQARLLEQDKNVTSFVQKLN